MSTLQDLRNEIHDLDTSSDSKAEGKRGIFDIVQSLLFQNYLLRRRVEDADERLSNLEITAASSAADTDTGGQDLSAHSKMATSADADANTEQ